MPPRDSQAGSRLVHLTGETSVHVRTRNGQAFTRSADGAAFVAETPGGRRLLGPYVADYEAANALLAAGAPLARLCAAAATAGAGYAFAYLLWLQQLDERGLLEFPLVDAVCKRAVLQPQLSAFRTVLASPTPEATLDRFACLRRDQNG
ncbi:MAG: hypothetical protein OXH04_14760 [Acidobacteria bacterium]|nr:hypothetical protein [Acidobacteriota bacterium]